MYVVTSFPNNMSFTWKGNLEGSFASHILIPAFVTLVCLRILHSSRVYDIVSLHREFLYSILWGES